MNIFTLGGDNMSIEPKELLLKMKESQFVFDTKIGQTLNNNSEDDKKYVVNILDLLYENYSRVRYVDDLSDSKIGKGKWAVLVSEKFAMMDKRIPIPQVPFHIVVDGKNKISMSAKNAYMLLIGFFKETDDEVCVALNFKNREYRKVFKENVSYTKVL